MRTRLKFVALFLAFWPTGLLAASYTPTVLGGLPSSDGSYALGVSSGGAVGYSVVNGGAVPLLWEGTGSIALATPLGGTGVALSVNNAGSIAGSVQGSSDVQGQPAVWQSGQLAVLGSLGQPGGTAWAINSAGTVVGTVSDEANGVFQAALWNGGNGTILGNFPGGQATAVAINGGGSVLINVGYPGLGSETWVWTNGTLSQVPSLGGNATVGRAINSLGDIAGAASSSTTGNVHAFLYKAGVGIFLPDLDDDLTSFVRAINDSDQIVGTATTDAGTRALLWQNGQVFDLNNLIPANSGWDLTDATGIMNDGTIVGYGVFDGQGTAFELTPAVDSSVSVVPEPGSGLLVLTALPMLVWRRKRCGNAALRRR